MPIKINGMTPLIQVFDMPRSLAFYRDILGFEVVSDSGDGDNSSWIWLRLNGTDLMLNDQYEPGSVPLAPPAERTRWHKDTCLYFGCPDPDTAYDYLKSKGVELDLPTVAPYGAKQLYVHDPDGYNLCFQCKAERLMPHDEPFQKVLNAVDRGDFSRLETMLGGPEGFDRQIVQWYENSSFDTEPEMLAEALSCACMLGRTETACYLLDNGVDPYAGMKTWLAGPHYAVSGGHLDTVQMLIEKKISLEVKNKYGGTMLGQALWSAVNEHKDSHAEIIKALIDAGAVIEPGTLEWWETQDVPSAETKKRVVDALQS